MYADRVRRTAVALSEQGQTFSEVSRSTGISRATLRAWGQRPRASPQDCPRCDERHLAAKPYSALLGYYLGDGSVSEAARCLVLRFSCDEARPGIIDDIRRSLLQSFPSRRVHHVRAPGVVVVQSSWVHWARVFPQHGPGRKHERPILLADWQRACIQTHPADFLRGLFHSDGCRTINSTRVTGRDGSVLYTYPRWQFVNQSQDIRVHCGWALDLLEIPWRYSSATTISVSTRPAVARLDAMIGIKS